MPLATGTSEPTGTTIVGEDIYIEGGPNFWFQDADAPLAHAPDSDSIHWGLSGTYTYPIYEIACYEDFSLIDTITRNPVQCDSLGVVDEIMRRESLEIQFTLKSLLPLSQLTLIMNGGTVVENTGEGTEKFGLGEIPDRLWHTFFSRVYDPATGDYLSFTGHRARFVEASPLETPFGEPWNIAVTMKLFADRTKPDSQRFGSFVRLDPSVIV